jgi:hypothetical protein
MEDIKGTIRITERRIIIKKENLTETYIKTKNLTENSWIEYKGEVYELELEDDSE